MTSRSDAIYSKITGDDLAVRLDLAPADVARAIGETGLPPLGYRRLREDERLEFYRTMIDRLAVMALAEGVQSRPDNWQTEWGRVLETVRREGISLSALRPAYYDFESLRLDGDFAFTDDPAFEHHFYIAVLKCLFTRYLTGIPKITDLGCGTASSLFLLSEMFPDAALCGCDWATPSQEIIAIMSEHFSREIGAVNFDMGTLAGGEAVPIDGDTAVITLHAMEQLGRNFEPLLGMLIEQRPRLVLHLEPLVELYDTDDMFDQIAHTYHRQREYLEGYLPRLQQLAVTGDIEILQERRLKFGSLWHEAYSVLVWRPTP